MMAEPPESDQVERVRPCPRVSTVCRCPLCRRNDEDSATMTVTDSALSIVPVPFRYLTGDSLPEA